MTDAQFAQWGGGVSRVLYKCTILTHLLTYLLRGTTTCECSQSVSNTYAARHVRLSVDRLKT